MSKHVFPRRTSRREFLAADAIAAGGMVRSACCFYQHRNYFYIRDLASRATGVRAHDGLAANLGDGKEANGKTNRPVNQTNPALFAAPHSLTVDSKGNLGVVERVSFGCAPSLQTQSA